MMPFSLKRPSFLAALLILSSVLGGCSDSTGASPPDIDKMILFSAQTAAPSANVLYGVMPDGSGLYRFAEKGMGQMLFPRRSRDRQRLAFLTGDNVSGTIWTMRADVTGAHTVYASGACPSGAGSFSWSPSGDRLLADCDTAQTVIKVSDGTSYSLSQAWGRLAFTPDWSPLGDRILYQSGRFNGDIYVANLDGSGATLLASPGIHAKWSPDGTRIAFERPGTNHQLGTLQSLVIFVANADGSGQRQLTFPADSTINDDSPAWSPDGTRLVFVRYQVAQPDLKFHLNVINGDGTGLKTITPDSLQSILRPDW
jgi:Tol biopolymer transport system component